MNRCGGITKEGNSCPFPGTHDGYCTSHVPDAALRSALLAEKGRNGAAAKEANRVAVSEEVAAKLSLRTDDDQLRALETACRNVLLSKLDAAKVAAAVATLVKVAREVIHGGLEDKADRLAKLLADNPTLAARLQVIK